MNDKLQFVYSRRSIRRYNGQMPDDEQINALLKAGFCAPSSMALYPCHFVVIKEREKLKAIKGFHDKAIALDTAPMAIIVCADSDISPLSWRDDAAAATMNILYAAVAMDIAACWHGIFPREHRVEPMRELLSLPEKTVPYSMITLGFANDKKPPRERFDQSFVHSEKW